MPNFSDEEWVLEKQKIIDAANEGFKTELTGLKNKNIELLDEKKKAKLKADDAIAAVEAARLASLKKDGDHEALAKSWKEKHDTLQSTVDLGLEQALNATKKNVMIKAAADIAGEFKDANFATPMIMTRLTTSVDDTGDVHVKVLDSDGKPSASTLSELKAELITTADKSLLKGPNSGGGGSGGGGGAPGAVLPGVTKADMTKEQRAAAHQAKLNAAGLGTT